MWQGDDVRPRLPPGKNEIGDRTRLGLKVIRLRVLADHQCDLKFLKSCQDLLAPRRRTLGPRWQISGLSRARVAESHRQDRNELGVVELFFRYSQPVAEPVSAGVVERHAGFVDFPSRRLARNQNPRFRTHLQYGSGTVGQMTGAELTRSDFG